MNIELKTVDSRGYGWVLSALCRVNVLHASLLIKKEAWSVCWPIVYTCTWLKGKRQSSRRNKGVTFMMVWTASPRLVSRLHRRQAHRARRASGVHGVRQALQRQRAAAGGAVPVRKWPGTHTYCSSHVPRRSRPRCRRWRRGMSRRLCLWRSWWQCRSPSRWVPTWWCTTGGWHWRTGWYTWPWLRETRWDTAATARRLWGLSRRPASSWADHVFIKPRCLV